MVAVVVSTILNFIIITIIIFDNVSDANNIIIIKKTLFYRKGNQDYNKAIRLMAGISQLLEIIVLINQEQVSIYTAELYIF